MSNEGKGPDLETATTFIIMAFSITTISIRGLFDTEHKQQSAWSDPVTSVIMPCVAIYLLYADCRYDECCGAI